MKRFLSLFAAMLMPMAGRATLDTWINSGVITTPPQVDAINFVNYGTIDISTYPLPFDTSNTRNFTNSGTMVGMVGWRFDTAPANSGQRRWAANFVNRNTGVIQALDGGYVYDTVGLPILNPYVPSKLFISATNAVSQGQLQVGANGVLELEGKNVNVSRSLMQVTAIGDSAHGSFKGTPLPTNFIPEVGFADDYWGQTNMNFDTGSLWDGADASSPVYQVQYPFGFFGSDWIGIPNALADSYTNAIMRAILLTNEDGTTYNEFVLSNIVKQAVFVGVDDPTISVWTGFNPAGSTNRFTTIEVLMDFYSTNQATLNPETTTIYFQDELASRAGRGLQANAFTAYTFRPTNYLTDRLFYNPQTGGYRPEGPAGNNGYPTNTFLYDPEIMTNRLVQGAVYSAYEAFVDNLVSRPPPIPSGTTSNNPGRIRIVADSLDMTKTRLRGEGEIKLEVKHLIDSAGAVVDCENLSYNLGSTNGSLNVVNLAGTNVTRLKGYLRAWSGTWSNTIVETLVFSNNYTFSNSVSGGETNVEVIQTPLFLTNVVAVGLHALMLDARGFERTLPVTVYDLITHSTNVVINDSMTVVQSLFSDGQSFTLNGNLTLSSISLPTLTGNPLVVALPNWVYTNAPNLRCFTNNGTLVVPQNAHFGDDGPANYQVFVNRGRIQAGGQYINSDYCELSGTNRTTASFNLVTIDGKVEGGRILSGNDVSFTADTLKLRNAIVSSGSRVNFSVAGALLDNGPASSNSLTVHDGLFMLTKPPTGDLLGTTLNTLAPAFARVDHLWSGNDLGADKGGFSNNLGLGRLVLTPQGLDPLFFFKGTGAANGLYVDYLDLSDLSDFQNEMLIDENLVIYYAAAKLDFTPPPTNGVPQQPEEYLDGQLGGHLRWVRNFAGPNSSVDVIINGQIVRVNRALRFSRIIDSDNDGMANYYDTTPFGGETAPFVAAIARANHPPPQAFAISWNATSNTVYEVEFATNNEPPMNWQPLLKFTNSVLTNGVVTVWDTNVPTGATRRFYRVGYSP